MDQEVNIIRIENWKRLILEANNSGLSKTEWCRQNNISSKTVVINYSCNSSG